MPWSHENPPEYAIHWPADEREAAIRAGNAALRFRASDESATYAGIRAAMRVRRRKAAKRAVK